MSCVIGDTLYTVTFPPHYILQVPIYAAYLYDAVSVYATALQEALAENIDVRNGAAILAKIKGRIYESESKKSEMS